MLHAKNLTTALLVTSLIAAGIARPAHAAGPQLNIENGFFGNHDDEECLTLKQVERALKRKKLTEITRVPSEDINQIYAFTAVGPKRNGDRAVWYVRYDACERALVTKEDQS